MQEKLYPELWIKNLPPRRKIYFLNESRGGKEEKHIFTQLVFMIASILSTDLKQHALYIRIKKSNIQNLNNRQSEVRSTHF